ncbi:nucleotidyltransferase substrate binding protein [Thermus sp.]
MARLASALAQPKDEFVRDSAIQRFEFTFELSWKTLKTYLELQGLRSTRPFLRPWPDLKPSFPAWKRKASKPVRALPQAFSPWPRPVLPPP